MQRWLKKDRAFLSWQRELEKDALEWRESAPGEASGRDEGRLLRGRRLEEAERWLRERERDLGEGEREFLQASLDLREREGEREERAKQEKERTRRRIYQIVALFTIISISLFVFASNQIAQVNGLREEAVARNLASQSEQMRIVAGSLTESVLLAVESLKHKETPAGFAALRKDLAFLPRPVSIIKHNHSVRSIAFSPDGGIMATGCDEGTTKDKKHGKVWLWNTSTGEKLLTRPFEHNGWVMSIDFSPDGKTLATGGLDQSVRVWDISNGKELFNLTQMGGVEALVFSPDGKRLAVGGHFSNVCIYDLSTNMIKEIPMSEDVTVYSLAFSPDGRKLAASNNTHQTSPEVNTVMIWNTSTWDLMIKTPPIMHSDKIQSIAFSPDGTLLATGCRNGKAEIINASTGSEVMRLDHGKSVVEAVSFSPDGRRLATACNDDNTFRIWDLLTQSVVVRAEHDGWVRDIAFSPDGDRVATASTDNTSIIWELYRGEPLCLNYGDYVSAIAFSPDGTKFASASNDGMANVWNLSNGSLQFSLSNDSGITWLDFSRDGKKLATGCRSGKARVWDASEGRNLTGWLGHNNSSISYVAFSPNGAELATADGDNNATVWDLSTGQAIVRLPHNKSVAFVAFSPDGRKLATASRDLTYSNYLGYSIIKVWNSSNWQNFFNHTMKGGEIYAMQFSPDGRRLAIGGEAGAREIIDAENGTQIKNLYINNYNIYAMNFSPDGTKLAVTGMDRMVWIYNASTGEVLLEKVIPGYGYGYGLAFSPDGSKLAIARSDKFALIIDSFTGKEILDLQHYDDVYSVAFSPDGTKLATGSKDGTARIWTLDLSPFIGDACGLLTHNMTREEWSWYMDRPNSDCITCPAEGSFGRRECQPCGGSLG